MCRMEAIHEFIFGTSIVSLPCIFLNSLHCIGFLLLGIQRASSHYSSWTSIVLSERSFHISSLQLSMNLGQWISYPKGICIINLRVEGRSFLMECQQGLSRVLTLHIPETVAHLALNLC